MVKHTVLWGAGLVGPVVRAVREYHRRVRLAGAAAVGKFVRPAFQKQCVGHGAQRTFYDLQGIMSKNLGDIFDSQQTALRDIFSSWQVLVWTKQMSTCASAGGKVLLAGGYLVLDPEFSGVVISTSSRFYTVITNGSASDDQPRISVRSPQFKDAIWTYFVDMSATHLISMECAK